MLSLSLSLSLSLTVFCIHSANADLCHAAKKVNGIRAHARVNADATANRRNVKLKHCIHHQPAFIMRARVSE